MSDHAIFGMEKDQNSIPNTQATTLEIRNMGCIAIGRVQIRKVIGSE